MVTAFTLLPSDAQLADAADLLMHSSQHTFPIADPLGRYLALLSRNGLINGLHAAGPMGPALSYARIDLPTVTPGHLFSAACNLMREFETPALPVLDSSGRLVGLTTALAAPGTAPVMAALTGMDVEGFWDGARREVFILAAPVIEEELRRIAPGARLAMATAGPR